MDGQGDWAYLDKYHVPLFFSLYNALIPDIYIYIFVRFCFVFFPWLANNILKYYVQQQQHLNTYMSLEMCIWSGNVFNELSPIEGPI